MLAASLAGCYQRTPHYDISIEVQNETLESAHGTVWVTYAPYEHWNSDPSTYVFRNATFSLAADTSAEIDRFDVAPHSVAIRITVDLANGTVVHREWALFSMESIHVVLADTVYFATSST